MGDRKCTLLYAHKELLVVFDFDVGWAMDGQIKTKSCKEIRINCMSMPIDKELYLVHS